nr:hypothetical protein [Candidatus Sigynarchaeota archaeon]
TAMNDPLDTAVMLHEMATVGGTMTISLVATWAIIVLVSIKLNEIAAREKHIAAVAKTTRV